MTELVKKMAPPKKWVFPVLIITGSIIGLPGFIIYASNAVSYLSDKSGTCINGTSYPDISTKEKAQKFIGLPMEKLKSEKEKFKQELLLKWKKAAQERENK